MLAPDLDTYFVEDLLFMLISWEATVSGPLSSIQQLLWEALELRLDFIFNLIISNS